MPYEDHTPLFHSLLPHKTPQILPLPTSAQHTLFLKTALEIHKNITNTDITAQITNAIQALDAQTATQPKGTAEKHEKEIVNILVWELKETNREYTQELERKERREKKKKVDIMDMYSPSNKAAVSLSSSTYDVEHVEDDDENDQLLSQQEKRSLQLENESLLNEFQGMNSELDQAHTTVAEIMNLQQQLEAHVSQQHETLTHIAKEAEATTENITAGNANLIKAREDGRAMTKFVIFFILLMTLVLLFLDYYAS